MIGCGCADVQDCKPAVSGKNPVHPVNKPLPHAWLGTGFLLPGARGVFQVELLDLVGCDEVTLGGRSPSFVEHFPPFTLQTLPFKLHATVVHAGGTPALPGGRLFQSLLLLEGAHAGLPVRRPCRCGRAVPLRGPSSFFVSLRGSLFFLLFQTSAAPALSGGSFESETTSLHRLISGTWMHRIIRTRHCCTRG